jgi:hypothetical protein
MWTPLLFFLILVIPLVALLVRRLTYRHRLRCIFV